MTFQEPQTRIRFCTLSGTDFVVMVGSEMLRESLNIDMVRLSHQRISEVGELFAAPDSAARADLVVSLVNRVSESGLT